MPNIHHPNPMHCPHEESSDAEKEAFYTKLEEKFDSCPHRKGGDVPAGDRAEQPAHTVTNERPAVHQRCAASRGMVVRSTFFPRKDIHKVTWTSPNQRTETQIDHVFIDGRFYSDIRNICTYRGADIHSVGASMHSKLSTTYYRLRSRLPPPFNTERLQNTAVAQHYVQ
ncbi:uncharacterized protein LOC120427174 [Culex pipiens pallens]|uniref:uncharacterized protein LOC120427174 n=1 Tax=Culex pipiens pallens TaxID=42434 RepID=UPI001953E7F1|nr:uncharacterized protein LOC120427174 [Culex pipiens pallens]